MLLPNFQQAAEAATHGHRCREALLLSIYCHLGVGTGLDEQAAERWFAMAIDSRHAEYLCHLGEIREAGKVLARDFVAANRLYRDAMELDRVKGAYMLARLAMNPTPENPFRNVHSFLKALKAAADLGHVPAQVLLVRAQLTAGGKHAFRAVLSFPSLMFNFLRAVLGGNRHAMWRYGDVFSNTKTIRRYLGADRKFYAPKSIADIDFDRLAP